MPGVHMYITSSVLLERRVFTCFMVHPGGDSVLLVLAAAAAAVAAAARPPSAVICYVNDLMLGHWLTGVHASSAGLR